MNTKHNHLLQTNNENYSEKDFCIEVLLGGLMVQARSRKLGLLPLPHNPECLERQEGE